MIHLALWVASFLFLCWVAFTAITFLRVLWREWQAQRPRPDPEQQRQRGLNLKWIFIMMAAYGLIYLITFAARELHIPLK